MELTPPAQQTAPGLVIATLAGLSPEGLPRVLLPGATEPVTARVAWLPQAPCWEDCGSLRVLVGFLGDDRAQPIIVALMDAPPSTAGPLTVQDGAVRLDGEKELVLECGKAKVALRADGRIEIRGGYLLSRSTGPNKIRGATVDIN